MRSVGRLCCKTRSAKAVKPWFRRDDGCSVWVEWGIGVVWVWVALFGGDFVLRFASTICVVGRYNDRSDVELTGRLILGE
jgi:hypothetical protein